MVATEIINTSLPFPYFSPNTADGPIATNPNIIAGRYTFQSSGLAQPKPPLSTDLVITRGIIKKAIVIIEEWNRNVIYILVKDLSLNTSNILDSSSWYEWIILGGCGTAVNSTPIAIIESIAVNQNSLSIPQFPPTIGATIIATAKLSAIVPPIIAIAWALSSSLTRSAIIADTTEPIAPAPCRKRPSRSIYILSLRADIIEPAINIKSPISRVFFLPILSLISPKGTWKRACVRA